MSNVVTKVRFVTSRSWPERYALATSLTLTKEGHQRMSHAQISTKSNIYESETGSREKHKQQGS